MSQTKTNSCNLVRPPTSELDTDERMRLIANLVVDKIKDDEISSYALLKRLERELSCGTSPELKTL